MKDLQGSPLLGGQPGARQMPQQSQYGNERQRQQAEHQAFLQMQIAEKQRLKEEEQHRDRHEDLQGSPLPGGQPAPRQLLQQSQYLNERQMQQAEHQAFLQMQMAEKQRLKEEEQHRDRHEDLQGSPLPWRSASS